MDKLNFRAFIQPMSVVTSRYYYLKDHLGSIRVTVDQVGSVKGYDDYDAWGKIMNGRSFVQGLADTRYKFLGKEREIQTGFDVLGPRFYDSDIGRFHSTDPLYDLYPDQSPYSYSFDNPLTFLDPSGMGPDTVYHEDDPIPLDEVVVTGDRAKLPDESPWLISGQGYAAAYSGAFYSSDERARINQEGMDAIGMLIPFGRGLSVLSKAARALRIFKKIPKVNIARQGKHVVGHKNYIPGRSRLTADPTKLAERAGTGKQVGEIPVGSPGSKERIDFGEVIGYWNDQPTTKGIIHYSKDGIHIVPARP
jgi:RHS repeat-associated protein